MQLGLHPTDGQSIEDYSGLFPRYFPFGTKRSFGAETRKCGTIFHRRKGVKLSKVLGVLDAKSALLERFAVCFLGYAKEMPPMDARPSK